LKVAILIVILRSNSLRCRFLLQWTPCLVCHGSRQSLIGRSVVQMLGRKDGASSTACSKPPPRGEQGFTPTGTGSNTAIPALSEGSPDCSL
jgi:hypothetical protein